MQSDIAAVNNAAGVKKKPRPMSAAAGGRRREREGRDFEYTPTAIAAVSDLARAEATK